MFKFRWFRVSAPLKIIWKPFSFKMSTALRVRSSGSVIRKQRDAEAEPKVCTCNTVFVINLLNIISCKYPVMYSLSERERLAENMQGTVFILVRLKIVLTIKNLICRSLIYDWEM